MVLGVLLAGSGVFSAALVFGRSDRVRASMYDNNVALWRALHVRVQDRKTAYRGHRGAVNVMLGFIVLFTAVGVGTVLTVSL
jgi:hypothetical protein